MANVFDVANYFLALGEANEAEDLTNLKLQKLVYYAQGFHLALFDKPLFDNEIQAWTHGPVSPELYSHFKDKANSGEPVPFDNDTFVQNLNDEEKELVEEVFNVFGKYSAWKLRDMTHTEQPWMDHESFPKSEIPQNELKEYFKTRINVEK